MFTRTHYLLRRLYEPRLQGETLELGALDELHGLPSVSSLAPGESLLVCHPKASTKLLDLCDVSSGELQFNGDDAVGLVLVGLDGWYDDSPDTKTPSSCNVLIDTLGFAGLSPPAPWPVGGSDQATKDHTLLRDISNWYA